MLTLKWIVSGHIPTRSICQLPIGDTPAGVFQHDITVPLCEDVHPVAEGHLLNMHVEM